MRTREILRWARRYQHPFFVSYPLPIKHGEIYWQAFLSQATRQQKRDMSTRIGTWEARLREESLSSLSENFAAKFTS